MDYNVIDQEQSEKEIDFKELHSDEDIINAFNYIVRKFPKGYPLASPVLRFPDRTFNRGRKNQGSKINESDNEQNEFNNKKHEKFNTVIKPKVQAFDYFVKDRYQIIFKSTPTISVSDLFDELEKEWKNLSYEDKLPYILLEIKDIKRYYMDQCEISKERRGKKRKMTLELLENELRNQDIPQNNEDEGNTTIIISNSNNNNDNNELNQEIILKPRRRIRRVKNHSQKQLQKSNEHENSTLIVNSEDEQEIDNNIISLKKSKNTDTINNNTIDDGHNHNDNRNTILVYNEMEDNYIDSDTSEEYLAFDNVSRKFLFENYNEDEAENNNNNKDVYNFDIQEKIGLGNKSLDKNDTFIPVKDVDLNSSFNHSLSQDTVVYNSQNESNELSNENLSNRQSDDKMDKDMVIKSTTEHTISHSFDKSQSLSEVLLSPNTLMKTVIGSKKLSQTSSNNDSQKIASASSNKNEKTEKLSSSKNKENSTNIFTDSIPTTLETPPAIIESSMKTISSMNSSFSYLNDSNNLETPKNSQSSKSLLKPLKPVRKSSSWKFGNDIGIIQQVSEEKISFISNKNKDDDSDEDDLNSGSSSSSSSEDEEMEEDNESNIFINKEKTSSNNKSSNSLNNIKENSKKYQSSTPSKVSSPIKYRINRRIEEDEDIEEVEASDKDNENEEFDDVEETEDEREDNKNETEVDNQNRTPTNKNTNSNLKTLPNWSDTTKSGFNKFIFENSYVTPKKNDKFKFNYSSNKKKNNYYGMERKKYDLF